jgi:PKD repeat protein
MNPLKNYYFLLFLGLALGLSAQTTTEPAADFSMQKQGNKVIFSPIVPPQQAIPGAPLPSYDYYWEFGDGTYSNEKNPTHLFAHPEDCTAQLWATGKYDKGKSPKSRPKRIEGNSASSRIMASADPGFPLLPKEEALQLRCIRNPRPGEELVFILTYANLGGDFQTGSVHLFFNQKTYANPHFSFLEARTHFGEIEENAALSVAPKPRSPAGLWAGVVQDATYQNWLVTSLFTPQDASITERKTLYRQEKTWTFDGLQTDEKRHLFASMEATPAMLADTNTTITVDAVLIGQNGKTAVYTLQMDILASHDPNYIAVSNRKVSFRRVRSKSLEYSVHFQNNGEGPASTIQLSTQLPKGMEPSGIKVLSMYPECALCPEGPIASSCLDTTLKKGQVIFTFHQIYLPGSNQKGVNDRDSTKGFVKYRLEFGRKVKKYPFSNQASIVFDRNPPILTNYAETHFKPGWSIGAILGQEILMIGNISSSTPSTTFAGLSLSPFKPYKAYFQVEIFAGSTEKSSYPKELILYQASTQTKANFNGRVTDVIVDTISRANGPVTKFYRSISVVPLQVRKNLSSWFGVGTGVLVSMQMEQFSAASYSQAKNTYFCIKDARGNCTKGELLKNLSTSTETKSLDRGNTTRLDLSVFGDLQLGMVRRGPALGIRGLVRLTHGAQFLVAGYLSFKI